MSRSVAFQRAINDLQVREMLLHEMVEVPGPLDTDCWVPNRLLYHVDDKLYHPRRLSYLVFEGPIPDGMSVCHQCDNTWCINPDHLFLGTHTDNIHDSIAKGRFLNARWKGTWKKPELKPKRPSWRRF
jgi:HNH endonuclease